MNSNVFFSTSLNTMSFVEKLDLRHMCQYESMKFTQAHQAIIKLKQRIYISYCFPMNKFSYNYSVGKFYTWVVSQHPCP